MFLSITPLNTRFLMNFVGTRGVLLVPRYRHFSTYTSPPNTSSSPSSDSAVPPEGVHEPFSFESCTERNKRGKSNIFEATLAENFQLQLGGRLPQLEVKWEVTGPETGEPVLIIPALSASSHVCSNETDTRNGWWEEMVGPGKWIDTKKWKVICPSILGAPTGTTSPVSKNPETGERYGIDFPQITTLDQARVHKLVLDYMNIKKVHAVIGSSLGGMQALQLVVEYPGVAKRMINISATAHTSPGTVAIRRIQRLSVISDPQFLNGKYHEHGLWPMHGMKVARTVGLLSYRSVNEFNERFGWKPRPPYNAHSITFEVEKWLDEKTEPFCSTYDPNCYLILSRCMDLMDIGMTWASSKEALRRIKAKSFIIGVNTDTLIYPKEQLSLADHLKHNHITVCHEIVKSKFGHDAFLHDIDEFGSRMKQFMEDRYKPPPEENYRCYHPEHEQQQQHDL